MELTNILWLSYILPILNNLISEIKNFIYSKLYKSIIIKNNAAEYENIISYITSKAINVNKLILSANITCSQRYLKNTDSNYGLPIGRYFITEFNTLFTIYIETNLMWISTYSWKDFDLILKFISASKEYYNKEFITAIGIYELSSKYDHEWELKKQVFPRPMNNIILPNEIKQTIFTHLDVYSKRESFYKLLGITYKTGLLFNGLPGTGKTTILKSLCKKYDMKRIYNMSLENDNVWNKISNIPKSSMIVIEDIDRYFKPVYNQHTHQIEKYEPTFSINKLLNMLDGILSPDKCIIIITTNNINILPNVIFRPGRIDLVVEFTYCTEDQIRDYTKLFFKVSDSKIVNKIVKNLKTKKFTVAQLQSYYMNYIDNIELAYQNVGRFEV